VGSRTLRANGFQLPLVGDRSKEIHVTTYRPQPAVAVLPRQAQPVAVDVAVTHLRDSCPPRAFLAPSELTPGHCEKIRKNAVPVVGVEMGFVGGGRVLNERVPLDIPCGGGETPERVFRCSHQCSWWPLTTSTSVGIPFLKGNREPYETLDEAKAACINSLRTPQSSICVGVEPMAAENGFQWHLRESTQAYQLLTSEGLSPTEAAINEDEMGNSTRAQAIDQSATLN